MSSEEAIRSLKRRNPFAWASAGDPWDDTGPHVPGINRHAFDGIRRLMALKRRYPTQNLAALILGEAGSGKTHMIGQLRSHCLHADPPIALAYVQPIEDPEQAYRYLLREVAVTLCRPIGPSETSFLDLLVGRILAAFFEPLPPAGNGPDKTREFREALINRPAQVFRQAKRETLASLVRSQVDRIDRSFHHSLPGGFLSVFMQHAFVERQAAVMRWLKGDALDAETEGLLGIRPETLPTIHAREQQAREMIHALGQMMARFGSSVMVCFDRLENIKTGEQSHALGRMIELLVDAVPAMLPIACFRGDLYETRFKRELNEHIITRLQNNCFILDGCQSAQALELVQKRLDMVLGTPREHPFDPFDPESLKEAFDGELLSPREVIALVNQYLGMILKQVPEADQTPSGQLYRIFQKRFEALRKDPHRKPPNRKQMARAVARILESMPAQAGLQILNMVRESRYGNAIDFMMEIRSGDREPVPGILLIDVETHHLSVGSVLQTGIDFLNRFPSGTAVYIRDQRSAFPGLPRWPNTNEKRSLFDKLGGRFLFLDEPQSAQLEAIDTICDAVQAKGIFITDAEDQSMAADMTNLSDFIRDWLWNGHVELVEALRRALMASLEDK